MKKHIINILIIIFLIIFCYSSYKYYVLKTDEIESQSIKEELINEVIEEETLEDNETTKAIDFQKLISINKDIIGWIEIDNTNISYPLVKGTDNTYYLTHNIYKEYNVYGSIYLNYLNSETFMDNNTIIFGHNSHSKYIMFSDLRRIYLKEVENPLIKIYLMDKTITYQVYSTEIVSEDNESVLNIDNLLDDEKMLTLSTCYYKDSSKRLIVYAKILDIQENSSK